MADNRETLTIKFHPVLDADLIGWYKSIESKRNTIVKNTLRAGVGLPVRVLLSSELETQRDDIEILKQAVSRLPALIRQANDDTYIEQINSEIERIQNQHLADLNALADQMSLEREQAMAAQAAAYTASLQSLERRMNELAITGQIAPSETIEDAPRANAEELEARKMNMKKAKW